MKLGQYLSVNHISVRDFAERVGVSTEAIRLYVVGKRRPRAEVMAKIREATGGVVEPNDFFADEDAEMPVIDLPKDAA